MTTEDSPRETSAPGITIEQASAFLAEHVGSDLSPLRPLRQGGWSNAFAFDRASESFVVRFSAYRDDFDKDQYATRWHAPNLPIPEIIQIGEAPGGFHAISRLVPGATMDDLDGPSMQKTLPSLLAMLDALRTTDISNTHGFGGWDTNGNGDAATWAAYLLNVTTDNPGRRNHGWRAQLAASPVGIDRLDETFVRFAEIVPTLPNSRYIIHGDLMNYNVLAHENHISGVIDWGCSVIGDFLYDAAWIINYWPWRPAWSTIDITTALRDHLRNQGVDITDFDRRIHAYRIHMCLDDQAYQTYMRNWDQVEHYAQLGLTLARELD